MSTERTGGLRIRWPAQRIDRGIQDRPVGQAAPSGAARPSLAAPEGTAVGNCDDQGQRIAAGRTAFRARQRAIRATETAPADASRLETPSRPGSAQLGRATPGRGRVSPIPRQPQSQASERAASASGTVSGGPRQISVSTNLPNRLPILSIEIALVESALSEFLSSPATANDNEGGPENE